MSSNRGPQTCRWCFTCNNPSYSITELLERARDPAVRAFVGQIERGESGTPHFQCFVVTKNRVRMTKIKSIFGRECHIEVAYGSNYDNYLYCTKPEGRISETFVELDPEDILGKDTVDDRPTKRSKAEIGAGISDGTITRTCDLTPEEILSVSRSSLELALADSLFKSIPFKRDIQILTVVGPTGIGKTFTLRNMLGDKAYFFQRASEKEVWTGYSGQKILVLDEWKGSFSPSRFNDIVDKWQVLLDIKFGHAYANWTKIVILSNASPDLWWDFTNPNLYPLLDPLLSRLGIDPGTGIKRTNAFYTRIPDTIEDFNFVRENLKTLYESFFTETLGLTK